MQYEVSSFMKNIAITHCAQNFLGVGQRNRVLELVPHDEIALPTFECNSCNIVSDPYSSFLPIVVGYQSIANSHASGDRGFPAVVGNQKFSLNFQGHASLLPSRRVPFAWHGCSLA
jgi:hypothetical protein